MRSDAEKKRLVAKILIAKLVEMREQKGHKYSQRQMAVEMGVDHRTMSSWMNQGSLLSGTNIDIVAAFCGWEVYDALEIPRRIPDDPDFRTAFRILTRMNKKERKDWLDYGDSLGGKSPAPAQV